MIKVLAQADDVFGKISPPAGIGVLGGDPTVALAKLFEIGIRLFIIIAGIFLIVYLLWGAFDWINSGGEKEKIAKAQEKITNAVVGMILIFVLLAVWGLITGNILGIIKIGPSGIEFSLPTL
jgi:hypothetical protein